MEDKSNVGSDGDFTDRVKVNEERSSAETPGGSNDSDGGNGIDSKVESLVGEQAEEENKKTKELLLRANEFRDACIQLFAMRAKTKYDKGQQEHGGYLPTDVSFEDMEDEIIDNWMYLQAMKSKTWVICPEQRDALFHRRVKNTDVE